MTETAGDSSSIEPSAGSGVEGSLRRTLHLVGSVVAPTTALTALLFYFGWASTHAEAAYFGIDDSTLGFSTQDYILHSISDIFLPFGGALLIGVLLVWGHSELADPRRSPRTRRRVAVVAAVLGVVSFVVGVEGTLWPRSDDLVTPLGFAVGIGLSSYAVYLRRRFLGRPATASQTRSNWAPAVNVQLISLLIVLSLIWEIAAYAQRNGHQLAERVSADLSSLPGVVVYSPKRLEIDAPGVQEQALANPNAEYAFRTDGLRLLLRSNGRFFLLPAGWSPNSRVTIVLKDRDDLRLEFTSG